MSVGFLAREILSLHTNVRKQQKKIYFLSWRVQLGKIKSYLVTQLIGFQIGKGVQGCILSPCLFNLQAEYLMRNTELNEAQAGIKIAGRNINNLIQTHYTTLMAENKELKSLLMQVKEESEKVGSKFNSQKTKIMASGPTTSWQINSGNSDRLYFGGLQNPCRQ